MNKNDKFRLIRVDSEPFGIKPRGNMRNCNIKNICLGNQVIIIIQIGANIVNRFSHFLIGLLQQSKFHWLNS